MKISDNKQSTFADIAYISCCDLEKRLKTIAPNQSSQKAAKVAGFYARAINEARRFQLDDDFVKKNGCCWHNWH